jgi:hypothetical protein
MIDREMKKTLKINLNQIVIDFRFSFHSGIPRAPHTFDSGKKKRIARSE